MRRLRSDGPHPSLLDMPPAMRDVIAQEVDDRGLLISDVLSYQHTPELDACRDAVWWRCRYTKTKAASHYPVSHIARAWNRDHGTITRGIDRHLNACGSVAIAKNRAYECSRRAWNALIEGPPSL